MIEIPRERLSPELLEGVLEDFVLREGTDYGHGDIPLEDKIAQVTRQVERGQAVIVFDPDSETCTLLTRQQWLERQVEHE